MARPQQRYRGVRQRHWGSWVSEIRHPLLKTRIWLGTFESAEHAAKAYDEAARIMCGPKARTNFPYNPNDSQSSSSNKLISATLAAKLHKCQMASLQFVARKNATMKAEDSDGQHRLQPFGTAGNMVDSGVTWPEMNWVGGDSDGQGGNSRKESDQLEEHHIQQMIEELLDYGSLEFCSASST